MHTGSEDKTEISHFSNFQTSVTLTLTLTSKARPRINKQPQTGGSITLPSVGVGAPLAGNLSSRWWSSQPSLNWLIVTNKTVKENTQTKYYPKNKQRKIRPNEITLVQSPYMTLGQETRWVYSTMLLSPQAGSTAICLFVQLNENFVKTSFWLDKLWGLIGDLFSVLVLKRQMVLKSCYKYISYAPKIKKNTALHEQWKQTWLLNCKYVIHSLLHRCLESVS